MYELAARKRFAGSLSALQKRPLIALRCIPQMGFAREKKLCAKNFDLDFYSSEKFCKWVLHYIKNILQKIRVEYFSNLGGGF